MKYLIAVIALLPFVYGQTTDSPDMALISRLRVALTGLWPTADANSDGNWTVTDMESLFTKYDLNHDRFVTREEFTGVWNKDVPDLKVVGRGLFYDLDTNFDGKIEESDLTAHVARVDANGDGTANKDEFVDYFSRLFDILYKIATIQVPATGK